MTTRKDFEAVAQIVQANTVPDPAAGFDEGFSACAHSIASDLADYFESDNPRFDRERFMEACKP